MKPLRSDRRTISLPHFGQACLLSSLSSLIIAKDSTMLLNGIAAGVKPNK
jgi:hypothetical protein